MKVSVVVPVYNAEKYIERCVTSILNQTHKEFELILVDDASTDQSLKICRAYEKKDDRVKVITKKNGGPHSARKSGVNLAVYPYVMFVDADDWVEPMCIESMVVMMEEENLDYLIAGYTVYENGEERKGENQIPSGVYCKEDLVKKVYDNMLCPDYTFEQRLVPALWGKLFKTEIIRNIMCELDEDICIGEDLACSLKYILEVDKVCIANDNRTYHYEIQTESISNKYDKKYFEKSVRLGQYLDNTLVECGYGYLYDNINRYKAFLVYRLIGILVSVSNMLDFSAYIKDIKYADEELKKLLENCDINQLKISTMSKKLLMSLKQKRLWKFKFLSFSLFVWNKLKRRR